jgi:hypothetical protein
MTPRITTRLTSFVLAVLVTWTVFSGIDTMALAQHAGATQMSQSPAATQLAGTKPASRG